MKKRILVVISCILGVISCLCAIYFENNELNNSINTIQNVIHEEIKQEEIKENNIETFEMTEEEIKQLPTTEIVEQTLEQEEQIETEQETDELQGEISYNGSQEYPHINLGNYKGLTYYSQIDSRWKNKLYTSTGNTSQTIGSSGCGPTSCAMVVTAIKGTITPPEMADLFVQYGFRSPSNGTYWSAYRWVADVFDIELTETTNIDKAIELLRNNHYVIASCGNGLFTTGGHYIVLYGIEGDTIKIYDPYLYSGKFDTSTRRGKVTVSGNTVYCSISNFKNYANFKGAFAYKYTENVPVNNQPTNTNGYVRYVKVNTYLNIRTAPNGKIVGRLYNGTPVLVLETNNDWSRLPQGWVSSNYLATSPNGSIVSVSSTPKTTKAYTTGTYVTTSNLHVRTGAGTKYVAKSYKQLSSNARSQNKALGNYYYNGYLKGVTCKVTQISGNWGKTSSGWICLDYCKKK